MTDLTQQLSPHFTLEEFVVSQTASRRNLDNTPDSTIIAHLKTLCGQILEPARLVLGSLRISSGYRSVLVNRAVGGSTTSAHVLGYAADVQPLACTKMEFARWVSANCHFDQIILEFGTPDDPAWIHVSCDPRNRKQILRTVKGGYALVTL